MKRLLIFSALAAIQIQASERFLIEHLQKTQRMFAESVAGLSEGQRHFRTDPGRWSIAQCAEHIAVAEDFIFQIIAEKVMKSPAGARSSKVDDQAVLKMITDRSTKVNAPGEVQPKGQWHQWSEVLKRFEKSRARSIAFVKERPDAALKEHLAPHPAFGEIDASQWLLFMSGHTERHVQQINEVKAHPDFPKLR